MAEPTIRPVESDDAERLRELVDSSMTTSYALSPNDIDAILQSDYLEETLFDPSDDSETVVYVAELDGVLAGVASATFDSDDAAIRWLHVDPERRGAGVGSALFERLAEEFEERGSDQKRAVALAANTTAGAFFERFGYGKVDERQTEIGGRETVEYVYQEGAEEESDEMPSDDPAAEQEEVPDYPDNVTGEDGEELFLGEDAFLGTEGHLVPTYTDADRSEEYGYYCLNCESIDVSMSSMDRIRCANCGNTRKPGTDYDDSYL